MMKFRSSHRLWIVIAVTAMLLIVVAGQVSAGSAGEDVLVASPMPTEHPSAIVATGALNVRNGPDVSYRSVAVIYQGQVVTLLGRWWGSNWVSIRLYNGLEGWVNSVYLQTSVPIADLPVVGGEPPPQPEPVPPIAGPVAVVNTGALNVRSGPSPAYPSLAVVTSGQQLLLIGRNAAATWAKVQISNGVQGWVNVYYTQTSVPVVNLPVVDAPIELTPAGPKSASQMASKDGSGPGCCKPTCRYGPCLSLRRLRRRTRPSSMWAPSMCALGPGRVMIRLGSSTGDKLSH